tara:strand:- start:310 stop:849 length:540 start_codon:yes stop_codon:yes gene_type:complete
MLFYTGKGDKGLSHIGKKKIDKTCLDIESLGALDEVNSFLGVILNQKITASNKKIVRGVQEDLFIIQANIASLMLGVKKAPAFKQDKVRKLETHINKFEREVNPKPSFVISGSTEATAWLDYSRTLARKAEIAMLRLNKKKKVKPDILAYLNRLSSLLYAMARAETKRARKKEAHPSYT